MGRLTAFGGRLFAQGRSGLFTGYIAPGAPLVGAPTVASISPVTGFVDGGTFVTITGTNFVDDGLVVTVGGNAATSVSVVNTTTITGWTAAHADGATDVYVETTNGNDTLVDGFEFVTPAAEGEPEWSGLSQLLIEDFTPGDLAAGTHYLEENYNRYTAAVEDITLMYAGATEYGSNNNRKTVIQISAGSPVPSMAVGRGGSGLCARTYYVADDNQMDWYTPSYLGSLGSYTGAIVAQFYVRFPDVNGFYNADGGKFFELWYVSPIAGANRLQLGIKTRFYFSPGFPNGGAPNGSEMGHQPVAPYPTAINDGGFHRVTVLYKPNATAASGWNGTTFDTPSSRDGRAAAWIGGTRVCDISAAAEAEGTPDWCTITEVDSLGAAPNFYAQRAQYPNYVNGITAPFNSDYDDLKIWVIP